MTHAETVDQEKFGPHPINLHELPSKLRLLALQMDEVGAAVRYFGGFGPFGEWGALLQEQSAPMCLILAEALERMQGAGRA